ncbi:hypothetical protein evm_015057, partial [Chilo suppressalis]
RYHVFSFGVCRLLRQRDKSVDSARAASEVLPLFTKTVTLRSYHVFIAKVGSRSRKLVELATRVENNENASKTLSEDKDNDTIRPRSDSRSSSSSLSSTILPVRAVLPVVVHLNIKITTTQLRIRIMKSTKQNVLSILLILTWNQVTPPTVITSQLT